MKNVLILCTGNSCRSQIAHGYLAHFTDPKQVCVYSAGIETHGVNPGAIATMREDGIDISMHTSNHVSAYAGIKFDFVITVCDHAKEQCPVFPSKSLQLHFNFPDPAKAIGNPEQVNKEFDRVRDMIKLYIKAFIQKYLNPLRQPD